MQALYFSRSERGAHLGTARFYQRQRNFGPDRLLGHLEGAVQHGNQGGSLHTICLMHDPKRETNLNRTYEAAQAAVTSTESVCNVHRVYQGAQIAKLAAFESRATEVLGAGLVATDWH
jgi:hypothetical protein